MKLQYTIPKFNNIIIVRSNAIYKRNPQKKMNRIFQLFSFTAVLLASAYSGQAVPVPNSLFSDHAIFQRNITVPVWGTARDHEKIRIEFNGQSVKTVADNGKWMVRLKPLKAGGPFVMRIIGDSTIVLHDIYVGEVWVCGGQSNMGYRIKQGVPDGAAEIAAANYPQIRQFYVPYNASHSPVADVKGQWQVCTPKSVNNFTAVGYFFARDLYKKLNIPFGIIFSAVGGTPAECWTSQEKLQSTPELKRIVDDFNHSIETYPERLEKYRQDESGLEKKYEEALAEAKKDTLKPAPKKPAPPQNPLLSGTAGGLYIGMIQPLQPYAIKGVIWYQGEANSTRAEQYKTLFPALIGDWRKAWGEGSFPFLFVQVAPWKGTGPEIREAQLLTWVKTPATAMVVTTDCGNAENIHPTWKQPVGLRLSLAARAIAYQEPVEYSGPLYQYMAVEDSKIILSFSHAADMKAKGDQLKGFEIAGPDQKFVDAIAEIQGDKVIVYSPAISSPVAVRYGWAFVPNGNLYNGDDLPASPFRTNQDN